MKFVIFLVFCALACIAGDEFCAKSGRSESYMDRMHPFRAIENHVRYFSCEGQARTWVGVLPTIIPVTGASLEGFYNSTCECYQVRNCMPALGPCMGAQEYHTEKQKTCVTQEGSPLVGQSVESPELNWMYVTWNDPSNDYQLDALQAYSASPDGRNSVIQYVMYSSPGVPSFDLFMICSATV
jgi:hypothetical protein